MILADIVRRSLADPEFFYGTKRTNDVIADTARWLSVHNKQGITA